MNREVKTERVKGKGLVYTNPCPLTGSQHEIRVGNPKSCNASCPFFVKVFRKNGKLLVHCNHG